MQPYFLPYIGYFQLINAADIFIIYDNIEYTKKGWINRNRYLQNGKPKLFTIPLKKDSDNLTVIERHISPTFNPEKVLRQLESAYKKAPFFSQHFDIIVDIFTLQEPNLFRYIYYSVCKICDFIGITTKISISSNIQVNHALKSQQKVIEICKILEADTYLNSSGGVDLYSFKEFERNGLSLQFIQSNQILYSQNTHPFEPWLSIVDILMFNSLSDIYQMLDNYTITEGNSIYE